MLLVNIVNKWIMHKLQVTIFDLLLVKLAVSALYTWWPLMLRREIIWLEKFSIVDGPGKLDRTTESSTSSNKSN